MTPLILLKVEAIDHRKGRIDMSSTAPVIKPLKASLVKPAKARVVKKPPAKYGDARRQLEDRIAANKLSRDIQDFQFDF